MRAVTYSTCRKLLVPALLLVVVLSLCAPYLGARAPPSALYVGPDLLAEKERYIARKRAQHAARTFANHSMTLLDKTVNDNVQVFDTFCLGDSVVRVTSLNAYSGARHFANLFCTILHNYCAAFQVRGNPLPLRCRTTLNGTVPPSVAVGGACQYEFETSSCTHKVAVERAFDEVQRERLGATPCERLEGLIRQCMQSGSVKECTMTAYARSLAASCATTRDEQRLVVVSRSVGDVLYIDARERGFSGHFVPNLEARGEAANAANAYARVHARQRLFEYELRELAYKVPGALRLHFSECARNPLLAAREFCAHFLPFSQCRWLLRKTVAGTSMFASGKFYSHLCAAAWPLARLDRAALTPYRSFSNATKSYLRQEHGILS